jgi:hypothetical protein
MTRRLLGVEHGFDRVHHSSARNERTWQSRYRELAGLTQKLGRPPRSTAEASGVLVAWMWNQRRRCLNHDLSLRRQRQLEALPGWDWAPREARWIQRAEDLQEFITRLGRAPRIRSDDASERSLGNWYNRQRLAHDKGALTPERRDLFRYATRYLP